MEPTAPIFYLVWGPDGTTPPKKRYPTLGAAKFAARELSKLHAGQSFFVLKTKYLAQNEVVQKMRYLPSEEFTAAHAMAENAEDGR